MQINNINNNAGFTDPYPFDPISNRARMILADYLAVTEGGVNLYEIHFVGNRFVVWPDASLGQAESGNFYSQVQTPGYIIRLEYAGVNYTIHSDLDAERAFVVHIE